MNGGYVICCVPTGDNKAANAALIAAAPDLFNMLEMLAELIKCGCGHPSCNPCADYRMACDVLDKAAWHDN